MNYVEIQPWLEQALGSINTNSVDNHLPILLELSGGELDENSIFTIPDLPKNELCLLVKEFKLMIETVVIQTIMH